jgi:protein-S-isoprenylcysteine O-methyltransferase Ste14
VGSVANQAATTAATRVQEASSLKHRFWIDTHKGATGPIIALLITLYGEWSNTVALVYLGLHGTYGILWILKSRFFPDKSWERPVSLAYGLWTWFGLSLYLIAPWLIVSGNAGDADPWLIGLCVAIFGFGVMLHFASDMQKHIWLQLNRGKLLTEGLWGVVRNPNYLGELLIYGAFALLALHWAPALVLVFALATIWVPNMIRKDHSLSRHRGFDAYQKRTKLLIPYVW